MARIRRASGGDVVNSLFGRQRRGASLRRASLSQALGGAAAALRLGAGGGIMRESSDTETQTTDTDTPRGVSQLFPAALAPVTPQPGLPGFWPLAVQPVAEGSVVLAADAGIQVGPLATDPAPTNRQPILHAFFLPPSIFVKVAGVYFQCGAAFDVTSPGAGVFPLEVYAQIVRDYVPGPPDTIRTFLRIRNATAASQTVYYRVYKWRGLR